MRLAATQNVEQADVELTEAEREAAIVIEELKMINGLDLAAVMLRGRLLDDIENRALWSVHPGGYATLEEMARDQGISITELSQVRDLYRIIFPFIEEELGMSIPELWEQIGKSNFREMVPVLKCLIAGPDEHTKASVRNSYERLMDDAAATLRAQGITDEQLIEDGAPPELVAALDGPTDEDITEAAIRNLIEAGAVMSNRDLRQTIRPERTPSLEPTIIRSNGNRVIVMTVSDDQYTLFERRMGSAIDPIEFNMPQDPVTRQREAARIRALRDVADLVYGE